MMSQAFPLQPLLELAEHQTDDAAASLALLNRAVQQQEQKLALLMNYRSEYQQRLRERTAAGVDGAGLRNFHEFLGRLEQAIVQQGAALAEARLRAENGRQEWQSRRRKFQAFDKLSQRFAAGMQRREVVREQKLQDDFASRAARSKSKPQR